MASGRQKYSRGFYGGARKAVNPRAPKTPTPKDPPRAVDEGVRRARAAERLAALRRQGYGSTILTGSGGVLTRSTAGPKTLLGQ